MEILSAHLLTGLCLFMEMPSGYIYVSPYAERSRAKRLFPLRVHGDINMLLLLQSR